MSATTVGAEPGGTVSVNGVGSERMVSLPEIALDAWRNLAHERGLSEPELWGSFWAVALEDGGHRARLILSQFEADVEDHVFHVPDSEPWVSAVGVHSVATVRRTGLYGCA